MRSVRRGALPKSKSPNELKARSTIGDTRSARKVFLRYSAARKPSNSPLAAMPAHTATNIMAYGGHDAGVPCPAAGVPPAAPGAGGAGSANAGVGRARAANQASGFFPTPLTATVAP